MKIQDLRQLSVKKMYEELKKIRHDLSVLRFHSKTGQNQNTAKIKNLRKTIAQILTLLKLNKETK